MMIPTERGHLPELYVAARVALEACAKTFTPEGYGAAAVALQLALDHDELADGPQDVDTLASYTLISKDDSLERLIRRIEKKRQEWKTTLAVLQGGRQ